MKRINNFWLDENNNKWDADIYTEEKAIKASKTLTACYNCTDCNNCTRCLNCIKCDDCTDCRDCKWCTNCRYCSYCARSTNCLDCNICWCCDKCISCFTCRNCARCSECMDCNGCVGFKDNPQRIVGHRIGARSANPAVYWLEVGKEQCIIGCFRGTLDELEEKVKETYPDPKNKHHIEYMRFINSVRAYQSADTHIGQK